MLAKRPTLNWQRHLVEHSNLKTWQCGLLLLSYHLEGVRSVPLLKSCRALPGCSTGGQWHFSTALFCLAIWSQWHPEVPRSFSFRHVFPVYFQDLEMLVASCYSCKKKDVPKLPASGGSFPCSDRQLGGAGASDEPWLPSVKWMCLIMQNNCT